MRPIDADAFDRQISYVCQSCSGGICEFCKFDELQTILDDTQTLDVVSVVRCKDCLFSETRHYLGDTCIFCKQFCDIMENSDFCSRAERKDGEQDE